MSSNKIVIIDLFQWHSHVHDSCHAPHAAHYPELPFERHYGSSWLMTYGRNPYRFQRPLIVPLSIASSGASRDYGTVYDVKDSSPTNFLACPRLSRQADSGIIIRFRDLKWETCGFQLLRIWKRTMITSVPHEICTTHPPPTPTHPPHLGGWKKTSWKNYVKCRLHKKASIICAIWASGPTWCLRVRTTPK